MNLDTTTTFTLRLTRFQRRAINRLHPTIRREAVTFLRSSEDAELKVSNTRQTATVAHEHERDSRQREMLSQTIRHLVNN
jgi:hypothetical protein